MTKEEDRIRYDYSTSFYTFVPCKSTLAALEKFLRKTNKKQEQQKVKDKKSKY